MCMESEKFYVSFDKNDLPAAEIQKDKPKEKEKKIQQTAITSYFKK